MEIKITYDINDNNKKTYIIPISKLSRKEVEIKIKELMDLYDDQSYIREIERQELLKNRKEKLKNLWK